MKKHIFNAGPSLLADEVYESAIEAIKDFNGSGISILSISHRTKDFDAVMEEADSLFRELLHIPDNYKIFYVVVAQVPSSTRCLPTSWVRRPPMSIRVFGRRRPSRRPSATARWR